MTGVKVFIGAQNCYRDARRTCFTPVDPGTRGQISPRRYGEVVVGLRATPVDRQLTQVRVYTGRPNSTKDPKTYGAHMRQCSLAIDFVRGYIANEFDIGILASTDTDLLPAIEAVIEFDRKQGYDPVEVCAWHAQGYSQQLQISGGGLFGHSLPVHFCNRIADPTDYNVK